MKKETKAAIKDLILYLGNILLALLIVATICAILVLYVPRRNK